MANEHEPITKGLRDYANVAWEPWAAAREHLLQMCDNIDAIHRSLEQENKCLRDESERGDDWIKLPKDADGEVIHVGDKLHDGWHGLNRGEVEWLMLDRHGWWLRFKSGCERFYVHEFHEWHHHHKQPTVEDVLCEPLDAVDYDRVGQDHIIAEYAKRLRLVGEDE